MLLFSLISVFQERQIAFFRFVNISFGADFPWRMHIMQSHTAVDHFHAIVGKDIGDGSAASLIDLAQFTGLVFDISFFHDGAQLSQIFRIRIIASAFSSGTGIFIEDDAFAEIGTVVCFHHTGIIRIESGGNITAEHLGMLKRTTQLQFGIILQTIHHFRQRILEETRLHAGCPLAADFLFV